MTDLAALRSAGPVKTWSLLVTVLGNRRAGPQNPVSGPELSELFTAMGIKPEALRVAIHRLTKDGWIETRKEGRTRAVFLSKSALAQTDAVHPRVYGAAPPGLIGWRLHLTEKPVDVKGPAVPLTPTALASPQTVHGALSLPLPKTVRPDWVQPLPAVHRGTLSALLEGASAKTAAARMLTLHHWRRLVLQDGFWLLREWEPEGPARACQDKVLGLLAEKTPANAGAA